MGADPVEIVKLNNNAAVTVEVPLGGTDGTEAITYAVRETNEQGVPVSQDSTFLYEVTGEANVALSLGQTTGTVNITNTLGAARRLLSGRTIHPGRQTTRVPATLTTAAAQTTTAAITMETTVRAAVPAAARAGAPVPHGQETTTRSSCTQGSWRRQ